MNAVRLIYYFCKVDGFSKICFEEHKLAPTVFNTVVSELIGIFNESLDPKLNDGKENWNHFINSCSCSVAFIEAFPDRVKEFGPMIKDLILVIKDKTELVRKNAAVLLARLA